MNKIGGNTLMRT